MLLPIPLRYQRCAFMGNLLTIILFFIYLLGLGFTVTSFVRIKPASPLERLLLYAGVGLGLLPIFSIILNFLHLPLDWKIFLAASCAYPLIVIGKKLKMIFSEPSLSPSSLLPSWKFQATKSGLVLFAALAISALSLYIYLQGAFSYPYLEDEDPWGHAVGVKYVALEKKAYDPPVHKAGVEIDPVLSYIDPYPPAYDILLGILHQTTTELTWTLKFFNALIIALGFSFFYLWAKEFLGHQYKALLATLALAAVPSYLSHFIWAHALVISIFFPTLYAFHKIPEERRWAIIAALLVGSIWVSQNVEQPLKLTTMLLILVAVSSITQQRWKKWEFAAIVGGILLSLSWWGVMVRKYTLTGFLKYYHVLGSAAETTTETVVTGTATVASSISTPSFWTKLSSLFQSFLNPGGSASRAYTIKDFLIAKPENMINNPIGLGWVISLLALLGLVVILWRYKSALVRAEHTNQCLLLFWLLFTFWGVNGETFPLAIARGSFRIWMLLAIPVSLLAAEGIYFLKALVKPRLIQYLIMAVLIGGIILTSGYPKYGVNTSPWPTSASFATPAEPWEYAQWFSTLPANTKVFLYAPRDKITIGFGKFSCDWCQEIIDFRATILSHDATALHSFLRQQGYEYLLLNQNMDFRFFQKQFGENETRTLLPQRYQEIISSGLFLPQEQRQKSFVVFRVI